MIGDLFEVFGFLGGALLALLLVFLSFFCVIDYADCRGFAAGTGINTKWAWGCYAEVDGKWVPKAYAFGDAHEVRVK